MRIGKIESDFMDVKIEIRRLIDKLIPEENENLDALFNQVDSLINKATIKKVQEDENSLING